LVSAADATRTRAALAHNVRAAQPAAANLRFLRSNWVAAIMRRRCLNKLKMLLYRRL
jgi:hypothetical protein